jgi:hypothetical protein
MKAVTDGNGLPFVEFRLPDPHDRGGQQLIPVVRLVL